MMEDTKVRLNEFGLKATPQRLQVYAAMRTLGHASADTVYEFLGGRKGGMTMATVYNVLESMTEAGLLVRRPSFSNKMYFDVNTDHHCHLYRADTHEIADFDDATLYQAVADRIRQELPAGLVIDRVEVQILCHPEKI